MGSHGGVFTSHRDEVTDPRGAIGMGDDRRRDVIFTIDLGATPVDVMLTSTDARVAYTLTPECPVGGPVPPCVRGATSSSRGSTGRTVYARGFRGVLYVVAEDSSSFLSAFYDRTYSFELAPAPPLVGAGTCADPYVIPRGGLLLASPPAAPSALEPMAAACRAVGTSELFFAEVSDSIPGYSGLVTSSDDATIGVRVPRCDGSVDVCRTFASSCTSLRGTTAMATPTGRFAIDGILPTTSWIGFTYY
jgi:hypothetical protein